MGARVRGRAAAIALQALACCTASAQAPPLAERAFSLAEETEGFAALTASCAGCDWGAPGREAAALSIAVDGRYSQHVFLVRGEESAEYRLALGRLAAGRHTLSVALDEELSAPSARRATLSALAAGGVPEAEREAYAHAPILYARPGTLGRFSDVPLLVWYEADRLGDGRRLRYSAVFSNEDGGTPSDRLMATWGRLTDIEFVYGVELDAAGRVRRAEFQGPGHEFLPFAGAREGARPLLYVVTLNNMVADAPRGLDEAPAQTRVRFAPAPLPFDLSGTSREAVMDAHPWSYAASVREARREGRVDAAARPGDRKIPDPRRFATLEACAPAEDATLAFSLEVRLAGGATRWFDSDGGLPGFRIARDATHFPNGCFRGAVALPEGVAAEDLRTLRLRAFTRPPAKDEPPLPRGTGRARLLSVNKLFLLGEDDRPGPSLFAWRGERPLAAEGEPLELKIR